MTSRGFVVGTDSRVHLPVMTLAPIYYHLPRPGWARARLRAETVLLSETAPPAVRWRKQSTFSAENLPSCSTVTAERGSYKSLCLNHRARNFGTRFFNARRNLQLRRVRVRRFSARLTQCGNRANSGAILRITLPSQACGCLRKSPLHRVHFYHYYYSSSGVQVGVSQWLPAPHAISSGCRQQRPMASRSLAPSLPSGYLPPKFR